MRTRARQPALSDGVIQLTRYRMRDVQAHIANEDQETYRWFHMPRSTDASVRRAIRRWQRGWWSGRVVAFAIRDKAGRLMGGCELRRGKEKVAHVSYWIGPDFRGAGYASRALALLSSFAFEELGLARIEALVEPDNGPSTASLRRAGFREDAFTGAATDPDDETRLVTVWSLRKGDGSLFD